LVEKRTIVFLTLATLVWASITTGFTTYYYLEQMKYQEQLHESQQSLSELTHDFDMSATKRDMLSADYGSLQGEYQWFKNENYFPLMDKYEKLLSNLSSNYTLTLESPELNETYGQLLSKFQTLEKKDVVTKEELGSLLEDFYKLFTALAMKELEGSVAKVGVIYVSLCIDYGNQTVKWYNSTPASPGATLFSQTQKIAKVEYSYWPTMEPGHILVTSISNYTEGYWTWYYWDEVKNNWIFGPTGCDAWILKDNGIYKWMCAP
jgi:hypothetical protein